MSTPAPDGVLLFLRCCAIGAAAIFDSWARLIPNELVAIMAVGGIAHAALRGGPRGAAAALLGSGVGVALLYWPFARGLVGGGDVKLLGALGAWMGIAGAVRVLAFAAIVGGFLSLVSLLRLPPGQRSEVGRRLLRFARSGELSVPPPEHLERSRGVPYGLALALTALWVLLSGAPS